MTQPTVTPGQLRRKLAERMPELVSTDLPRNVAVKGFARWYDDIRVRDGGDRERFDPSAVERELRLQARPVDDPDGSLLERRTREIRTAFEKIAGRRYTDVSPRRLRELTARHAWEGSALLGWLDECSRTGILPPASRLDFLLDADRPLWLLAFAYGRPTMVPEVCMIQHHHRCEVFMGRALREPETGSLVAAIERHLGLPR